MSKKADLKTVGLGAFNAPTLFAMTSLKIILLGVEHQPTKRQAMLQLDPPLPEKDLTRTC
jgi:hypothetical protein